MRGGPPGRSARYCEGKARLRLPVEAAERVSGIWIIKESQTNIKAGGGQHVRKALQENEPSPWACTVIFKNSH